MKARFTFLFAILITSISQNLIAQTKHQTIYVNTIREFYEAIGSNRHIIIENNALDITALRIHKLEFQANPYVLLTEGAIGFTIQNVQNLSISGKNQTELFTTDVDDRVIAFEKCNNISLENLNLYHRTPTEISCYGEVIYIEEVNDFKVKNCKLNGSGTVAFESFYATNIQISNTEIFNNSNYFIRAWESSNIHLDRCIFFENVLSENGFTVVESDMILTNCHFRDNVIKETFINTICNNTTYISFQKCTFSNNREFASRKFIPEIETNDELTFTHLEFQKECKELEDEIGVANVGNSETVEASIANLSKEDWIQMNYSSQIDNLKKAGVADSDIDAYFTLFYNYKINNKQIDYINIDLEDKDIFQKVQIITALYVFESEKKEEWMQELSYVYNFPLFSYWGKTNINQDAIQKEYRNSWSKLISSYNFINSIKQISPNFFDVDLDYYFITKKSKKLQKVHSLMRIQFNQGKIVSVNPVKN